MMWWLAALATAALILAAAKAHGRQVRIEREQQGVFHVDFRRQNPPSVETIWRRDRRIFWPTMVVLSGLGLGVGLVRHDLFLLGLSGPWAFGMSFCVAGAGSWIRMSRNREGAAGWRRRAILGSLGWWALVAAAATLVVWSVAV